MELRECYVHVGDRDVEEELSPFVELVISGANCFLRAKEEIYEDELLCVSPVLFGYVPPKTHRGATLDRKSVSAMCECLAKYILDKQYLLENSANERPLLRKYMEEFSDRISIEGQLNSIELIAKLIGDHSYINPAENSIELMGVGTFIQHACAPNVAILRQQAFPMFTFRSIRRLAKSERLCVSSIPFPLDSRDVRRRLLGFECECYVCKEDRPSSHELLKITDNELLITTLFVRSERHCWMCGREQIHYRCVGCYWAIFCSAECYALNCKRCAHEEICEELGRRTRNVILE